MRVATFNVLADAYTGYGDYTHVNPELLKSGARTNSIVHSIENLGTSIVGLQEAEEPLVRAFEDKENWQTFWSPKELGKVDGCLMLVEQGLQVDGFETHPYRDGSGHIMQIVHLGRIAFVNTHIKWAPTGAIDHIGVGQIAELLDKISSEQAAVIFADSNDKPDGPVRHLIEAAGFNDMFSDMPTAIVNGEAVALDLLAVRGMNSIKIDRSYNVMEIPSKDLASDHIPLIAELEIA